MKKFAKLILSFAFIIPVILGFTGCDLNTTYNATPTTIYVVSVEKTKTEDLVDTYTIFFSNGTTSSFTIKNGKDGRDGIDGINGKDGVDGKDATSPTITEIYEKYVEEVGEISYADFLSLYLKTNTDLSKTINNCLLSSMKIYTEFYETEYRSPKTAVYCGSAVIYKIENDYTYVLTNYHVVYDADANTQNGGYLPQAIYGYLYGSEGGPTKTKLTNEKGYQIYDYGDYVIPLTYVGGAGTYDVAILKAKTEDILKINNQAKAITFAENYYVGEKAFAIGNAENEGLSVTQGIVSVDNEDVVLFVDSTRTYRSLRIDTAIYHGNSGGGLFNQNGELIGLTNAGDGDDQNVNYAVPLQIVKNVTENVLYFLSDTNNNPYKIVFGFNIETKNSRYVYNPTSGYGEIIEDIIVDSVDKNSIFETIDIKANDQIISYIHNDNEILMKRSFNIKDFALTCRIGDTIQVKYKRGNNTYTTNEYVLTQADFVKVV